MTAGGAGAVERGVTLCEIGCRANLFPCTPDKAATGAGIKAVHTVSSEQHLHFQLPV